MRTTAQVAYQRLLQDIKNNQTDLRRLLHHRRRPLRAAEGRRAAREIHAGERRRRSCRVFRNFDPDGFYHTTSAGLVVITYNTAKVKAEEAPKKWTDLLDPKWKGKVSIGHPGFSGYVGTWVLTMKKLYGWDYFKKLEKNKPQIGRSINDTVTMLVPASAGRGRRRRPDPVSAARGNPLAVVYPRTARC